jgi:hypothetical protein
MESMTTPEGPAAARCEVCGRSVRDCCRIDCEAQKSEQSNAALAEHAKCWRLGYELARARLVEVERERDEALAREGDMFAEANHRMIECNDLRARASAAEGALRELAGAVRDGATGTRMSLALIAADLALSGLPPLTSEAAGPVEGEGGSCPICERSLCSPYRRLDGDTLWSCACGYSRVTPAQPTPAALVPKEEDK